MHLREVKAGEREPAKMHCDKHGTQVYGIQAIAAPVIKDNGRIDRRTGQIVYLCPRCLAEGSDTIIGR